MNKPTYPLRAPTLAERGEGICEGVPVRSRREAIEVALSQVLGGAYYGSGIPKLQTHAAIVEGYVDQWDAAESLRQETEGFDKIEQEASSDE